MPGQHPHRAAIGEGYRDAADDAHGGDAGSAIELADDGKGDVGVEAIGALEQRRRLHRRQAEEGTQQQAEQDAAAHDGEPAERER